MEARPRDTDSFAPPTSDAIDAACDRFEDAWKAVPSGGAPPAIEDYRAGVPEADQQALLCELVLLDLFHRTKAGQQPQAEDYLSRFPFLRERWLQRKVRELQPAAAAPPPPPSPQPNDSTPPQRLRCPHCHNPIQLSDGHGDHVLCPGCGGSFQVRDARWTDTTSPSRPLGKFQLLERVGVGAFGAVWKARDTTLDRIVALKIPHSGLLTDGEESERFQREARNAAQLRHPGIVTVHEVAMLEGLPVIVADFVTGVPLKDLLEVRRLTFGESAALLADIAEAVQYAHQMGVVHRDLKPPNIMIAHDIPKSDIEIGTSGSGGKDSGAGRPLVMDFGLALRQGVDVTLTIEGALVGTPAYMSPEQAAGRGHKADARSDVYSLGVILYEVLTGELPFRGSKLMMLHQVLHEEPRSPRKINDKVPRDLETICLKCLEKDPKRRYTSAAALAADLRRFLAGEPLQARAVTGTERLWKWARRRPAQAALIALTVLALLGVIVGVVVFGWQAEQGRLAAEESTRKEEGLRTTADAKREEAEAARNDLQKSKDKLLTSVARSLLGPLGLQSPERGQSAVPLTDPEIEALWELANSTDESLRLRFVEAALLRPGTTRQLKNRAVFVMNATVGLDLHRREAIERMLAERMVAEALPWEPRTDLALTLVALGDLSPQTASGAAATLNQGISKTTNHDALAALAPGLSAMAARLEPKEAAAACREAVATLTLAINKTTDYNPLRPLAQGLSAVAARLGPKEAKEAAARLTLAISKTTNPYALAALAQGLSAVAARLGPKEAAAACREVAATLTQAISKTTDPLARQALAQGLSAVAARLGPKEAKEAASRLTQAISKTTDPLTLVALAQGLSAVAAHLGPKEASACREAAATLTQAISKTTDPNALMVLAWCLSAVAARLEPKDAKEEASRLTQAISKTTNPHTLAALAQGLSAVAARLEPKEAAAACREAVVTLTLAINKTPEPHELVALVQGLSAVAARLGPKEVAAACREAAATLTLAISKTTDPNALTALARGLQAVAAYLGPKEAKEAAATLTQTISKTTNPYVLWELGWGLSVVAARLEPKEAAATLNQAISKTTYPYELVALAQGLSVVAARLGPKEAAAACREAAVTLTQAISKTTDPNALAVLAAGLSAVAARLEPKEAAARLTQASSKTTSPDALAALAPGLSAVAAHLEVKEAKEAAARLTQASSKTIDPAALAALAQGLSAVAARLEVKEAMEAAATLTQATSKTTYPNTLQALAQGLSAVLNDGDPLRQCPRAVATVGMPANGNGLLATLPLLWSVIEPPPCRLSPPQLVELLKNPLCVGEARRIVLDALGTRYKRQFADQWDFVHFAREQNLGLDFTSPPERFPTLGGGFGGRNGFGGGSFQGGGGGFGGGGFQGRSGFNGKGIGFNGGSGL